jgi:disulfide bond formation protein DsbB
MSQTQQLDSADSSSSLLDRLADSGRIVALAAAATATAGSLFFSEGLGWIPCELCWYQRIAMYPIALIVLIGLWRGDRAVMWYALPLSVIGFGIALYHYLMVMLIIPPAACSGAVPCSIDYLNFSGALSFIKIPFLALTAFALILFGSIIDLSRREIPADLRNDRLAATLIAGAAVVIYAAADLWI